MAATSEQIVEAARACIGTPFAHRQRKPGVGMDCVQLVRHSYNEAGLLLGLPEYDYGRVPKSQDALAVLVEHFDRVGKVEARPGDVLWLRLSRQPQHFGIYAGNDHFIHASMGTPRRVTEERLTPLRWRQVHSAWRVRGG